MLIKVNNTVTNPTFKAVTISTTTPGSVTDNGVTFLGCFSSTEMAIDGTELFIGTDNYLYQPAADGNVIGGMRAYIRLSTSTPARMSVNIGNEMSVVETAKLTPRQGSAYTLQGIKTNAVKRGLYVIDGKKCVIR
jgi:hypothetical protein